MKFPVGQKVKTLVGWSGVPKGTTGTIVEARPDGFIIVEWDSLGTQFANKFKPLQDGFSIEEYDFLEAI